MDSEKDDVKTPDDPDQNMKPERIQFWHDVLDVAISIFDGARAFVGSMKKKP